MGRAARARGPAPVPPRVVSAVGQGSPCSRCRHTASPCGAWEGTAATCTCREWGSAGRGAQRSGRRAPLHPTTFITRPEQLSLEICLYQVSSSELHPGIGFETFTGASSPSADPASPAAPRGERPAVPEPREEMQTQQGAAGSWHQSGAGTAGSEGGRAHGVGLGAMPCPRACGVPAE